MKSIKARIARRIQRRAGVDLGYCPKCEESASETEAWGDVARDAIEARELAEQDAAAATYALSVVATAYDLPPRLQAVIRQALRDHR